MVIGNVAACLLALSFVVAAVVVVGSLACCCARTTLRTDTAARTNGIGTSSAKRVSGGARARSRPGAARRRGVGLCVGARDVARGREFVCVWLHFYARASERASERESQLTHTSTSADIRESKIAIEVIDDDDGDDDIGG